MASEAWLTWTMYSYHRRTCNIQHWNHCPRWTRRKRTEVKEQKLVSKTLSSGKATLRKNERIKWDLLLKSKLVKDLSQRKDYLIEILLIKNCKWLPSAHLNQHLMQVRFLQHSFVSLRQRHPVTNCMRTPGPRWSGIHERNHHRNLGARCRSSAGSHFTGSYSGRVRPTPSSGCSLGAK